MKIIIKDKSILNINFKKNIMKDVPIPFLRGLFFMVFPGNRVKITDFIYKNIFSV